MERNNRIKQTARKTTGGKPPSSKKGFFNSSSSDSAAQQHSDSQRELVQNRRSEHNPTLPGPDGQTHSPPQSRKQMSRGNTMTTHNPQETVRKDPDQTKSYAVNHILRNGFVWTDSMRNNRDSNEEEEDELLSFPSSSRHSPRNTEKSPVAKTRTKCDRCRLNGSNPVCLPYPGSKKCAKCVRDHRTCSWTNGPSGPSSSFGGHSSLKTRPEKVKNTSSEERRKASDPEHESVPMESKTNDPTGEAQQIGPKCKRCAANASNPICERSDDPNDAKCKKCRRDKQSCSFAPSGKPFVKRKRTISDSITGKGHTDEENDESGEEEEQNGSVETSLKENKTGAEDDAENKTELDSGESRTEATGDRSRSGSKAVGNTSSLKTKRSILPENQRDTSKRKKNADQDDSPSEGQRTFSKKKQRPDTASLGRTIPPASASHANGPLYVANYNSHHTSKPSSAITPRVISIPPVIRGQINGRTHAGQHPMSVGSPIVAQHTRQRPETGVQDRSMVVIEHELRAAEVKAASHRAIAESYLRDADRAEEEVAKLKEELLTAVRNNTSLGVEGVAAERKLLIEQLLGIGGDQRT